MVGEEEREGFPPFADGLCSFNINVDVRRDGSFLDEHTDPRRLSNPRGISQLR